MSILHLHSFIRSGLVLQSQFPTWQSRAPANSFRTSELSLCMIFPGEIHQHTSYFHWAFTNLPLPTRQLKQSLTHLVLFCRIPFSWCSSHVQYKLLQLLGTAGKGAIFFKPYVWIKSGTVAFWALKQTNPLIIRKSSSSSLLCLAVWTNVTPKEWKGSHISLQIQDFSISNYAIDGKSQSILFSPEESLCR